jgi:hypothetical protein
MTRSLFPIGVELAKTHGVGIPFDKLSMGCHPGKTDATTIELLLLFLDEIIDLEGSLIISGHLPTT